MEEARTRPSLGSPEAIRLRERAHELIPGGAHTYAKGDDQWPELTPTAIVRGKGCHVWDADGNEFIEYAPGARAVTLGHAQPEIVEAAQRAMLDGTNFTRPSMLELECAEELIGLIGPAEMAKFSKDGSTVTSAAVKIARAYTGRDLVACCADHPFFSYDDWFIGTTAMDAGIPDDIKALTRTFHYNDLDGVRALFDAEPDRIACVILEPEKNEPPEDRFLHRLQHLVHERGALLILDEMISGFRYDLHGAQGLYDLEPDLSTFGKGMANGFSVSALLGRREVMERSGIRHPQERVFALSATHGGETHGLAAALATMRFYREHPVVETLYAQGERLKAGVEAITAELGLGEQFGLLGRACNLVYYTRDAEGRPSDPLRTVFQQELVVRGILATSFVVSWSHSDDDVDHTIEAVGKALAVYAKALEDGPERYLKGPAVKPVYRAFN